MSWTDTYGLLALLLAQHLRKFCEVTAAEFINEQSCSQTAPVVAEICRIMAANTHVIGQMNGVGVVFDCILDVSNTAVLLTEAYVVLAQSVYASMIGMTYTQAAQYCILATAYTIRAVFNKRQLIGKPIPSLGMLGEHEASDKPLVDKLNQIVTELSFKDSTMTHNNILNMMLFTRHGRSIGRR